MTGAQFCAGSAAPVMPDIARRAKWRVQFGYSFRGEAAQIADETVEATSEATALKQAFVKRLGSAHRTMKALQVLAVNRVA